MSILSKEFTAQGNSHAVPDAFGILFRVGLHRVDWGALCPVPFARCPLSSYTQQCSNRTGMTVQCSYYYSHSPTVWTLFEVRWNEPPLCGIWIDRSSSGLPALQTRMLMVRLGTLVQIRTLFSSSSRICELWDIHPTGLKTGSRPYWRSSKNILNQHMWPIAARTPEVLSNLRTMGWSMTMPPWVLM